MTKYDAIQKLLLKLSDHLYNSNENEYLRKGVKNPGFINDEKNNRIGYALLLDCGLSHMFIWFNIDNNMIYYDIFTDNISTTGLTANYIIFKNNKNNGNLSIVESLDKDKYILILHSDSSDIKSLYKIDPKFINDYTEKIAHDIIICSSTYSEINKEANEASLDNIIISFFDKIYLELSNNLLKNEIKLSTENPSLKYDLNSDFPSAYYDIPLQGDIKSLSFDIDIKLEHLIIKFSCDRFSQRKKYCEGILYEIISSIHKDYPNITFDTYGRGKESMFTIECISGFDIKEFNDHSLPLFIDRIKLMYNLTNEAKARIKKLSEN